MKKSLKTGLMETCDEFGKTCVKFGIVSSLLFANTVSWGISDSLRTREALRWSNANNLVKTVTSAKEERGVVLVTATVWQETYATKVTFDDNSTAFLYYREAPLLTLIYGDMFQPKIGERYEVSDSLGLIRKID